MMGNDPVMTPAASPLSTMKYLYSLFAAFPLLQTRAASSMCSVLIGSEVHWWSSWLMGQTHFRDILGGFKALLLHRSVRWGPCLCQCFVSHLQTFSIVTQDKFECRVFCSSLQAKQSKTKQEPFKSMTVTKQKHQNKRNETDTCDLFKYIKCLPGNL